MRRRLEGVTEIAISEGRQTVEVSFEGTHAFPADSFREAVQSADVEVLVLNIEACGAVEKRDGHDWLVTGPQRFLLEGGASVPTPRACVAGRLDERDGVSRIAVKDIRVAVS